MTSKGGVHEKGTFELEDILQRVRENENFRKVGAIALFVGVARGESESINGRVRRLDLQAYEQEANRLLDNICMDLAQDEGIIDVQIHHLLGEFEVGEDLVYVFVAGGHRKEVFSVLQKAVDRYKKEVPIFKKEYVLNESGEEISYWVGEKSS